MRLMGRSRVLPRGVHRRVEEINMVQFGLQIEPQFGFTYLQVRELASACRTHGFESIWVSDHFMLNRGDVGRNCLDCWTLLAALAADVGDIRLGSLVTCMSYRNPPVLAKIAATVDMISGGRLEFGVGAGWKDVEYEAYGIPFPSPGERVDRFVEGIQIIRGLWTQPVTTFEGRYYRVKEAAAAPKPVQRPHPPILIGGSRPRMLRAMAKYADAVNMGGAPSPEAYAKTLGRLETYCELEGSSFDRIRKTHFMTFVVAEARSDVASVVARVAANDGMTADQYRQKRARAFIGTADGAVELIRRYAGLGVAQFMSVFPFGEELRSMRIFADRVIPRV